MSEPHTNDVNRDFSLRTYTCARGAIKLVMAASALSVPRLNASFPRPTIDRAIAEAVRKLDYSRATDDQANAFREFAAGRDVFVTLPPTGSGKSLCYAALPFVFDFLRAQSESPSIEVVVCSLQCTCTNISFSHHSSHYVIPTRSPEYVITVTPRMTTIETDLKAFFAAGE